VGDTAEQVDLPGVAGLDEGVLGLVAELGGEDGVGFCGVGMLVIWSLLDMMLKVGVGNVPAAAMEKGPWIAPSSSWVMKEGWAAKPTSTWLVFRKRVTYYKNSAC
jgi:hypothetical protein